MDQSGSASVSPRPVQQSSISPVPAHLSGSASIFPQAVSQSGSASFHPIPAYQSGPVIVSRPIITSSSSVVLLGQSNVYSSPLIQQRTSSSLLPQSTGAIPNQNPFFLKFIAGNVRTCQGCKGTLRMANGKVPSPSYDLTIARAERRPYRNTLGTLVTPRKESNTYYHCRLECVRASEPSFVPFSLHISNDVHGKLIPIHREYLSNTFGLGL